MHDDPVALSPVTPDVLRERLEHPHHMPSRLDLDPLAGVVLAALADLTSTVSWVICLPDGVNRTLKRATLPDCGCGQGIAERMIRP